VLEAWSADHPLPCLERNRLAMPFPSLHPALVEALSARGYAEPTAVQTAVLQPEAAGRDLLVSAQTGSGKTVAYGLGAAPNLMELEPDDRGARQPRMLVIAPTRELALQVGGELEWLYARLGFRIVTCVGGTDMRRERRACLCQ
jgi:ATP-dependent RNA helicase DeaD